MREPPHQGLRPGVLVQAAAVLLVLAGIGLRLAEYALDRSLWLDEAFLALNIEERGFGELFGTLDFNQAAPVGYLLLAKAATLLLGDSEYALRLVAVVAAVASVPLFWMCARRILALWAAVLALGLFALGGGLLQHAAEVKPYSSDVLVAVVLLLLAVTHWPRDALSLRRGIAAGLVAAALVWFSYPAVFVVAGLATTLLVEAILDRNRETVRSILVVAALACGSFALLSATLLDTTIGVQSALKSGAPRFFLPLPPTSTDDLERLARAPLMFFRGSIGLGTWGAVLFGALALLGALSLARWRAWRTLGILLSPLPFVIAASAAGLYPFGERFTLFYIPFALLLVAEGTWALVGAVRSRLSSSRARSRAFVLGAALCGAGLLGVAANSTADHFEDPPAEAIKPPLDTIQDDWRPGDTLFLYFASQYAFRYYAECEDCGVVQPGRATSLWNNVRLATPSAPEFAPALVSNPPALVVGANLKDEPLDAMGAQLDRLAGRPRVWILFTHTGTAQGQEALATALRDLDARGTRLLERQYDGAALYLYDTRPS
jgi:4-amino-4-deoxy-L-arabinose transferase-like glycosyltransferase